MFYNQTTLNMSNFIITFHQDLPPEENCITLPKSIIDKNIVEALNYLLYNKNIPCIQNDIKCKFHLNYMFIYIYHQNEWNRIDLDLSKL